MRRQLLIPLLVLRVACLNRKSNNASRFWTFESPHPERTTTINRSMLRSTALIGRNVYESFRFCSTGFLRNNGAATTHLNSCPSCTLVGRNKHSAGLRSVESLLSDGPDTGRPDSGLPTRTVSKNRQQLILNLSCRVALLDSRATNHPYALPAPTTRPCGWVGQQTVRNLVCSFDPHRRTAKYSSRFPTDLPFRPDGTTRTKHPCTSQSGSSAPDE